MKTKICYARVACVAPSGAAAQEAPKPRIGSGVAPTEGVER